VRNVIIGELVSCGLDRQWAVTATAAPVPELRRFVARLAIGNHLETIPETSVDDLEAYLSKHDLLEAGIDPRWAVTIAATYSRPGGGKSDWSRPNLSRRSAVAYLQAHGGRATIDELRDGLGGDWVQNGVKRLLGSERGWAPVFRLVDEVRWKNGAIQPSSVVELLDCPHCAGHATYVLCVPELESCLLCPACRRPPVPDGPVYPAGYLEVPTHSGRLLIADVPTDSPQFLRAVAAAGEPERRRTATRRPAPNAETVELALKLYRAGTILFGAQGIFEQTGLSEKALYRLLDEHGIPRRHHRTSRRDPGTLTGRYSDETTLVPDRSDPDSPR
jgi:hypothetical protein